MSNTPTTSPTTTPRFRVAAPPSKLEFVCKPVKSCKVLPNSRVVLQIESNCLVIRDSKQKQEYARTPYEEIVSWASSDGTFAYEVTWESVSESAKEKLKKKKEKSKSKGNTPANEDKAPTTLRYVVLTKEGVTISDNLKRSVNIVLESEEKKLKETLLQYSSGYPLENSTDFEGRVRSSSSSAIHVSESSSGPADLDKNGMENSPARDASPFRRNMGDGRKNHEKKIVKKSRSVSADTGIAMAVKPGVSRDV